MTKHSEALSRVVQAIREAGTDGIVEHEGADFLSGHSGNKLIGLLQRLHGCIQDEDAAYLEIGVFQGLTLLSVAAANPGRHCYGIDNFAFFDPKGENRGIVLERASKLGVENAHLIDADYEDALESLDDRVDDRQIGVYFVDGPHDYRSQLMCLLLALPYLHPRAIIVVDDANYVHVRQANRDFLRTHPEFKLLFESYSDRHPGEMSETEMKEARAGWWDGVNVIVRDPDGELDYGEPVTVRDRRRFENDHLVHAARLSELAPEALRVTDALLGLRLHEAGWFLGKAWKRKRRLGATLGGRSKTRNTYSREITGDHWNPSA